MTTKPRRARSDKRVPVQLTRETFKKLKLYSSAVGVPMARVVDEAIDDWLNTVGSVRIEAQAVSDERMTQLQQAERASIETFHPIHLA